MEYKTPKILLEAINTAQLESISVESVKKFIELAWPLVKDHKLKISKLATDMILRKG